MAAAENKKLTSPITGRAVTDSNGHTWWLTEDGKVFRYNNDGSTPSLDFQVKNTMDVVVGDSFKGSEITFEYYSSLGVIVSASGNLFVIDLNPASGTYGKTKTMVTLNAPVGALDTLPPVFIDYANSNGSTFEVYALSNYFPGSPGPSDVATRLHQFRISASTGAILSSLSTDILTPFTGLGNLYEQYAKAPPVVFMRQLTFGTWRRHNTTSPGSDRGGIYEFDLNDWVASGGVTPPVQINGLTALARPVISPPAVEIDFDTGRTPYIFIPAGNYVYFANMVTGAVTGGTNALVLNPGDPDTGSLSDLNGGGENQQNLRIDPNGGIQTFPSILWGPTSAGVYNVSVVNCNALWKISLPYSGDQSFPGFSVAAAEELDGYFSTPDYTTYTKTTLGRTMGTTDPGNSNRYISNPCAGSTLWTGFYPDVTGGDRNVSIVMDNYGGPTTSQHCSIQIYDMNDGASPFVSPALGAGGGGLDSDSGDLHQSDPPIGAAEATELAGRFVGYYEPSITGNHVDVVFNTTSPLAPRPCFGCPVDLDCAIVG